MAKKLTRSKRRDLRARGQLKPLNRALDAEMRQADRRAEEEAVSARVHEAREEIAEREAVAPEEKRERPPRRDLTMLLVLGLVGVAGLIYYLSQRGPSVVESTPAATSAPTVSRPTVPVQMGETPKPPAQPVPVGEPPKPPPIAESPKPAPEAPPATKAAALPPTAAPVEPAKPKPVPAKPAPAKPAPRPAKAEGSDPYG